MPGGLVQGCTVDVYQYGSLVATGTTDENGDCTFALPYGSYTIVLSKEGSTTTSYDIAVVKPTQKEILNIPQTPIPVINFSIQNGFGAQGPLLIQVHLADATQSISISSPVVEIPTPIPQSITVAPSVEKKIGLWLLRWWHVYSDEGTLNKGSFTPSPSPVETALGSSCATTATTKQFCLYSQCIYDKSTVVNDNSSTVYEAIDTAHNYTVPSTTGMHTLRVYWKPAYEYVVTTSGAGTTNKTGTCEIAEGSTIGSITATANTDHIFLYWLLDGDIYSFSATISPPEQLKGTNHTLTAYFL